MPDDPPPPQVDLNRLRIDRQGGRRRGFGWFALLVVLAIGAGAGFALGRWWRGRPTGTADGALPVTTVVVGTAAGTGRSFTAGGWVEAAAPAWPIAVSAQVPELLAALHVVEGQVVGPGALLAELYDRNLANRLAEAEAARDLAAAEHALLEAGFRAEDVAAARAAVDEAAAAADLARLNLERVAGLPAGTVPAEEVATRRTAVAAAQARLARFRAEAERMEAGYRPEDVSAAAARLRRATLAVEQATRELGFCRLRAPADGPKLRVLRILHAVGDFLDREKAGPILTLYDPARLQVRVDVAQGDIAAVEPAAPVEVRTTAGGGRIYAGTVLRIEPRAELAKNTITVKAAIDEPDLYLFPDMSVEVTFLPKADETTGPPPLVVPGTAVIGSGDAASVWVVAGGRAVRRPVVVGEALGDLVEIAEGLGPGTRVIVDPPSQLAEGQAVRSTP